MYMENRVHSTLAKRQKERIHLKEHVHIEKKHTCMLYTYMLPDKASNDYMNSRFEST